MRLLKFLFVVAFLSSSTIQAQNKISWKNISFENKQDSGWEYFWFKPSTGYNSLNYSFKKIVDSIFLQPYKTVLTQNIAEIILGNNTPVPCQFPPCPTPINFQDSYTKQPLICPLPDAGTYTLKLSSFDYRWYSPRNLSIGARYRIQVPANQDTLDLLYYATMAFSGIDNHGFSGDHFFFASLVDSAGNDLLCSTNNSNYRVKYFATYSVDINSTNYKYNAWKPYRIKASGVAGKQVYLQFAVSNCTSGGCIATAYIDFPTNPEAYNKSNYAIASNNSIQITLPIGYEIYKVYDSATNTLIDSSSNNTFNLTLAQVNKGYYVKMFNNKLTSCTDVFLPNYQNRTTLFGKIITPTQKLVQRVALNISGTSNRIEDSGINGNYNIQAFLTDSITITPFKNNDVTKTNGVNTLDLALLQLHILNKRKFTNPYQIIAADVNGDGLVNAIDAVLIRRFIMGTDSTFFNKQKLARTWEFVDSSYTFPNLNAVFPFKKNVTINKIIPNSNIPTFIGIKLGDINFDWNDKLPKSMPTYINTQNGLPIRKNE